MPPAAPLPQQRACVLKGHLGSRDRRCPLSLPVLVPEPGNGELLREHGGAQAGEEAAHAAAPELLRRRAAPPCRLQSTVFRERGANASVSPRNGRACGGCFRENEVLFFNLELFVCRCRNRRLQQGWRALDGSVDSRRDTHGWGLSPPAPPAPSQAPLPVGVLASSIKPTRGHSLWDSLPSRGQGCRGVCHRGPGHSAAGTLRTFHPLLAAPQLVPLLVPSPAWPPAPSLPPVSMREMLGKVGTAPAASAGPAAAT